MPTDENDATVAREFRRLQARISLKHYRKEMQRQIAILGRDPAKRSYGSPIKEQIRLALAHDPEATNRQVLAWIDDHWQGERFFRPENSLTAVWKKGGRRKRSLEVALSKVRTDQSLSAKRRP
jgi:hypothetical protein